MDILQWLRKTEGHSDALGNTMPPEELPKLYDDSLFVQVGAPMKLFTINLSPDHIVRYLGCRYLWSHLPPRRQYHYFRQVFDEAVGNTYNYYMVPGKCKNGMLHVHAVVHYKGNGKQTTSYHRLSAKLRRQMVSKYCSVNVKEVFDIDGVKQYLVKNIKEWSE